MSVWFCIPTSNPDQCSETFAKWRARGYRTAALVCGPERPANANFIMAVNADQYRGWPGATNQLCAALDDPEWIVAGGADMMPDPLHDPLRIAHECTEHFGGTYGVMQPYGDRYGAMDPDPPLACVSPWMGREWRRRANRGKGPLCQSYFHFYADGELLDVATAAGRLWLRPELTQYHDHWTRRGGEQPPHMNLASTRAEADKKMYLDRKRAGFPDAMP
jgi:hypothetical protein